MPNGKAGDNPLNDMFFHNAHPFPSDIEAMLRKIDKVAPQLLDGEIYSEAYLWAHRKHLRKGRKKLKSILTSLNINPQTITIKAVIFHSFYLASAILFFCSGALLWYLAYNGIFVLDLGGDFVKWIYPFCSMIIGIPFLARWIRNR